MADKKKIAKIAAKYIPKKAVEKKIRDFGAKNLSELRSKIDSVKGVSEKNRLLAYYTTQYDDRNKEIETQADLDKSIRRSERYGRIADDADYMESKMRKSILPMVKREAAQTAKAQAGRLSVAPSDATRVARVSIPLAETQFNK